MKEEITAQEYGILDKADRNLYCRQYQEYIAHQPGAESWVDISETKAGYTNNTIRKIYRLNKQCPKNP